METTVKGLYLIKDILTPEEASSLVENLEKQLWFLNRSKKRRIQIYGPKHDKKYNIIPDEITPLPQFLKDLCTTILERTATHVPKIDLSQYESYLGDDKFTEIFVNEYKPDDSLDQHFDHRKTYKEIIFGLSLECDSTFTFTKKDIKHQVKLPARSLYLMTGSSRKSFKHGIEPNLLEGDRRISLTFRTVNYPSESSSINEKKNSSTTKKRGNSSCSSKNENVKKKK
ncbi:predicted protein [Naegleria gruberi]|uniref:Predicted protein n=1 Tax=Naegleria gruberi TaxID=5762 RepID=D2VCK4_NAEGR|nr:uncharacterized protein NAEGRDRAFT_66602 [Naegleria gruberi]EFC45429.1 predicted protein [Naegleria gruberi]|eukprot:XP_002678173.1 predicted protein [Naegleria gruberi strain NEG-M]